jgi:phosphoglycolate phosphatase
VRLWLFDLDGTLLHAGGSGRAAFDAVLLAHHEVADGCRGVSFGGKTDPALVDEVFRARLGRPPSDAERAAFLDAYLGELADRIAATGVRRADGATELLAALADRPGELLGVATGNVRGGADQKLAAAELAGWFADGVGGYGCDSAVRGELVAIAISRGRARGEVHEVVVVGDTVHDIAAARANGATAIAVATGGQTAAELSAADVVLGSLRELPGWLATHDTRLRA